VTKQIVSDHTLQHIVQFEAFSGSNAIHIGSETSDYRDRFNAKCKRFLKKSLKDALATFHSIYPAYFT
jgi:hypothetical protein